MQDWLNNNLGKIRLNPDPPNGIDGQCVNAASSWSIYQGGPELRGATAWEIWQNFNSPFYQRVTGGYQPGDIVFFLPNNPVTGTGYAGHVDIMTRDTGSGFVGADTNWGSAALQLINHRYVGIAGAFRKINAPAPGPTPEEQDVANENYVNNAVLATLGIPNVYNVQGKTWNQPEFKKFVGQPSDVVLQTLLTDPRHEIYVKGLQQAANENYVNNAVLATLGIPHVYDVDSKKWNNPEFKVYVGQPEDVVLQKLMEDPRHAQYVAGLGQATELKPGTYKVS